MARLREFDEDKAIDAAVDCFWARGYEATSVRELADCMKISGASLYNAYGDKRALFVTALARYCERSMRERIERIERDHAPKEAIGAFLAEIIERSLTDRDRKGCLLVNSALDVAPHDAGLAAAVAGYLGELRAFFRRSILAARAAGEVPADLDADEASGHFLGVLMGIRVLARATPNRKLLEAVARPALRLLDLPSSKRARQ
jgi:TetR/AcrR family transcriptional regulator, transcriptional repressor for nem operon